jgi:hypothetical protein
MKAKHPALALLAGLALTLSASADEVRGQIVSIDLARKVLRFEGRGRDRGQTLTLTLTADTRVQFGRQAGELADLSAGRRGRLTYDERDGKKVVREIRVAGARPARRAARPAPTPSGGDVVTGTLQRVALTEREVVVVGPKGEVTITVPEKARVTRDGKEVTFDDLEEGERAAVQVERRAGRLTAVAIRVGAGVAKEAPAGPGRPDVLRRVRMGLQIADAVLGIVERARSKQPERER